MKTIAAIKTSILRRRKGKPFAAAEFAGLGSRTGVDRALARLAKQGFITRAARGVYVRPRENKLIGSKVPPSPESVVRAKAKSTGEKIGVHGAEAARKFGLTTQMPAQIVFNTTGKARTLKIGLTTVRLNKESAKFIATPGDPASEAIAALLYLGKENVTTETITQLQSRMSETDFARLVTPRGELPWWLTECLKEASSHA